MSQLARNPSNFSSIPNPSDAFDTLICAPEPRKSFRSLLTVLLFKVFFYHGMFRVGMHRFNGSLHNSAANFRQCHSWFFRQHTFQTSQSNSVRRTVVHKASTRRDPKYSDCDVHEITETVERLRSSCCLQAFKISQKSLPLSRRTVIFKKHVPARCSFSWLLGSSTSRSDSILIPHVRLFCQSVGLILNSSL